MTGTEPFLPYIVVGGALAVVGMAALWSSYLARKRREALAALASELGLEFHASDDWMLRQEFASFHLFLQGHGRAFTNVIRGRPDGTQGATLCDFEYTTGSGKSRHTSHQSVALLSYPKGGLPTFELRPENVLHKIGALFGYQDIDFPASPAFSGNYLLRGKDEQAVRQLFGINLLQFFENHPGWWVEGGGRWLAVYRHERLVKPEDMRTFLDDVKLVLWAFPK